MAPPKFRQPSVWLSVLALHKGLTADNRKRLSQAVFPPVDRKQLYRRISIGGVGDNEGEWPDLKPSITYEDGRVDPGDGNERAILEFIGIDKSSWVALPRGRRLTLKEFLRTLTVLLSSAFPQLLEPVSKDARKASFDLFDQISMMARGGPDTSSYISLISRELQHAQYKLLRGAILPLLKKAAGTTSAISGVRLARKASSKETPPDPHAVAQEINAEIYAVGFVPSQVTCSVEDILPLFSSAGGRDESKTPGEVADKIARRMAPNLPEDYFRRARPRRKRRQH